MEKIKQFLESEKGKNILIVLIVILVGLASFELGRLSKVSNSSGIKITYPEGQSASAISTTNVSKTVFDTTQTTSNLSNLSKNFFASNKGKKYYTLGCTAGKSIKQENRIYFSTADEAQGAGYTLSSSCN